MEYYEAIRPLRLSNDLLLGKGEKVPVELLSNTAITRLELARHIRKVVVEKPKTEEELSLNDKIVAKYKLGKMGMKSMGAFFGVTEYKIRKVLREEGIVK